MTRHCFFYTIIFSILYFIQYYFHTNFFEDFADKSPLDLNNVYLFHLFFAFTLVLSFSFLSKTEKFKDQLGFLYLVTLTLKIFLFCVFFRNVIFSDVSLSITQGANLLIPIALPIIFEVVLISKLLKELGVVKNDK